MTEKQKNALEKRVSKLLMNLGINSEYKGFHYIVPVMTMYFDDPKTLMQKEQEIFTTIAEQYSTTYLAVDRAIRNAIKKSWHKRNRQLAKEIFSNNLQSDKDIPTTKNFLHCLYNWLKYQD